MKRLILCILAIFLLTAGAALAQSANTTAPGPTQQREPGQVSNNLPNPGNPQTDLTQNKTYTEGGTTEGTANESMTDTSGTQTTGSLDKKETEPATGPDVDVDTGAKAEGAVDVDVSAQGDTDTDASGIDETGTDTGTDTGALPDTASEFPLLALAGLLALATAVSLRVRRNA